jgi:hypothetical protein
LRWPGFAPGVLIYVVSYQFVSRSIESWFDVKVEGALDAGLNLGRVTLETLANDLANKARMAAPQLSGVPDAAATLPLERLRDQLGASDVVLFNGTGQQITPVTGSRAFRSAASGPRRSSFATHARRGRGLGRGAGRSDPRHRERRAHQGPGGGANPGFQLQGEPRFLLVTQALPGPLVANALAVTRPTASTRSARWRARACGACTSARSR